MVRQDLGRPRRHASAQEPIRPRMVARAMHYISDRRDKPFRFRDHFRDRRVGSKDFVK